MPPGFFSASFSEKVFFGATQISIQMSYRSGQVSNGIKGIVITYAELEFESTGRSGHFLHHFTPSAEGPFFMMERRTVVSWGCDSFSCDDHVEMKN